MPGKDKGDKPFHVIRPARKHYKKVSADDQDEPHASAGRPAEFEFVPSPEPSELTVRPATSGISVRVSPFLVDSSNTQVLEQEPTGCFAWICFRMKRGARQAASALHPVMWMCFSIAFYFLSSLAITTYNKWLVATHGFRYPVTLIWSNTFTSFFLALFLSHTLMKESVQSDPSWWPRLTWRRILGELVPIALLFSLDTTTTNAAFEDISVPLTEVVKSCIPLVILVVHFCSGREAPSMSKFVVILLLTAGTAMTSMADSTFTVTGFLFATVAMFSGSARLLLLESVLTGSAKIPPLLNLLYLSPISCLSLCIPFFILEYDRISKSEFFRDGHIGKSLGLLAGSCSLAFCLNLSQMMLIAHTSALTMCVVGIVKLVFVIGVTMVIFGYQLTPVNETGVFLSILGASLYNYLRVIKLQNQSLEAGDSDNDDDDDVGGGAGSGYPQATVKRDPRTVDIGNVLTNTEDMDGEVSALLAAIEQENDDLLDDL